MLLRRSGGRERRVTPESRPSAGGEADRNLTGLDRGDTIYLTAADGRLIVSSGNGELVVVAAEPAKYRELSRRRVLIGSTFWASPVLCGGLVYVRSGEGELACLDHRASDPAVR